MKAWISWNSQATLLIHANHSQIARPRTPLAAPGHRRAIHYVRVLALSNYLQERILHDEHQTLLLFEAKKRAELAIREALYQAFSVGAQLREVGGWGEAAFDGIAKSDFQRFDLR